LLQEACVVLGESCTGVVHGGGGVHGGHRYYRVCGGIETQPSPTGEHTSFKLGCGSGARRLEGGALALSPHVIEAAALYVTEAATACGCILTYQARNSLHHKGTPGEGRHTHKHTHTHTPSPPP
tara:strand:- start:129 stop:500 length:372 start_codon:yes stop_codon:yes gene_type:complete